ncbi:dihydrofolate reductase [Streptococcus equinus]|uniref:dihydrofolate reductase n=1 Tax=Streptococcus equinus TaxID=1335 RepID=UPI0008CD4CEF|nr:dihydrofolate reductase [Streptococcus equinus]SEI54581.1 dihydrofolate reductase [Streptococcus equinus]
MTKKIVAIWAEDENHLIGVNGGLPWRLPKELKHFKETTMGQALLMGRVTFDGMKRRILPGRETLILTRDKAFEADGVTVVHDMDQVFEWFKNHDKTLYVVGGASIYKAFLPYCDEIIKTTVHGEFEGDTYFPDVDLEQFTKVSESFYEKDDKNAYDFTITVFEK